MREKRSALPVVALLVALVALAGVVWTRFDPPYPKLPAMSLAEMEEMTFGPSNVMEAIKAGAAQALEELGPHLDDWARRFVRATIDDDMERTVGLVMHGREDGVPFSVKVRAAPSRDTAITAIVTTWGMVSISDGSTEEKARAFGRMLARFYKKITPEDD